MKKEKTASFLFVGTLFASLVPAGATHASPPIAGTRSVEVPLMVNVRSIPAITVTINDQASESASIDITPNYLGGVFNDSNDVSISIATSNRTGYYLNMTTSSASLNSITNSGAYIPGLDSTVTTGYTTDNFPTNRWGYALKTGETTYSNFFGVGSGVMLQDTDAPTGGTVSTLKFGAKVDSTIPVGSYSTTMVFTAITKPSLYMQDVAVWGDTVGVGESLQVIDNRDMKTYWVTRVETDPDIPDGRADCTGSGANRVCTQLWMTQNLDLDLEAGTTTFTHYNTDLGWSNNDANVVWTPQVATSNSYSNNNSEERSVNLGDDKFVVTSNNGNPDSIFTLDQCLATGNTRYDCMHYHAGNLYNYYAAAALGATSGGNVISVADTQYTSAPNSICPAGWRLPTGATAANGYSDFDYLLYRNSATASHRVDASVGYATHLYGNNEISTDGFNNLRTQPLWFARAGYGDNAISNQGSNGRYWSNTICSNTGGYHLNINRDLIFTAGCGDSRQNGISVRCLAR